jgi:hypothetical protein
MARSGIMEWIRRRQDGTILTLQDVAIRDLRMLVEISGGLSFVHRPSYGRETSPIFMAMEYTCSFISFRIALNMIDIDICELVHAQIDIHPDGWTLERLLSLALDQTIEDERDHMSYGRCRQCRRHYLYHPDEDELAWKRKVNRIKNGVDIDAPLSEEEETQQKALDDAIMDYENGICHSCHLKDKRKKSIWNPLGYVPSSWAVSPIERSETPVERSEKRIRIGAPIELT